MRATRINTRIADAVPKQNEQDMKSPVGSGRICKSRDNGDEWTSTERHEAVVVHLNGNTMEH